MADHTIHGASAPPGTYGIFSNDGSAIRLGAVFYSYGSGLEAGATIAGGRLWCPPGVTLPANVTISLFMDPSGSASVTDTAFNLSTTPVRSATVATGPAGAWVEARWTPVAAPAVGVCWMIGYQFEGTDKYLYSSDFRSAEGQYFTAADGTKFCQSEYAVAPNIKGSYYRAGTSPPAPSAMTSGHGIDAIIVTGGGTEAPPAYGTTVVAENALTGSARANWLDGVTTEQLPAFTRSTFYAPGATLEVSVASPGAFTADVYRLGNYQGHGARLVKSGLVGTPATQPAPVAIAGGNGAVTCAAWSRNLTWQIPTDALPGWYYVLLRGAGGGTFGNALFCVSDAAAKRPMLIVSSDSTWHAAYNGYGGNNVYGAAKGIGSVNDRAFCSTYDKPVITQDYVPQTHFFNATYPFLKWAERLGYEVGYATIEQINLDPTIVEGRGLVVWTGHNEYTPDRVMDAARSLAESGKAMLVASGNDFFWRAKMTDGALSSTTPGRVMWCRKDTMSGPTTGPNAQPSHVGGQPFADGGPWTGTWQDTRWAGRRPPGLIFADRFVANGIRSDRVQVPESMKGLAPWRDCASVQALQPGQTHSFAVGTLGMEWDVIDAPVGTLAVRRATFSASTVDLTNNTADENGEVYTNSSTQTHGFTAILTASGSRIVNLGSEQWAWALDALHLRGSAAADLNAQQMTANVIADLSGILPDSSSAASMGVAVPVPVADYAAGYALPPAPVVDPPEINARIFYSDGSQWLPLN